MRHSAGESSRDDLRRDQRLRRCGADGPHARLGSGADQVISTQYANILQAIDADKKISDETQAALKAACEEFKKSCRKRNP